MLVFQAGCNSIDRGDHVLCIAEIDEPVSAEDPAAARTNERIRVRELRQNILFQQLFDWTLKFRVSVDLFFQFSNREENTVSDSERDGDIRAWVRIRFNACHDELNELVQVVILAEGIHNDFSD